MHALRLPEGDPADEGGPVLAVPFRAEVRRAPVWLALASGLVSGALAAAVASPKAGAAVGVATLVVLLVPRLRILLALAAIAGIVIAGTYTAVHQAQFHVLPNGGWPTNFQTASKWAWAGVVFLGAEGIVDIVLRRRATKAQQTAGPDTP